MFFVDSDNNQIINCSVHLNNGAGIGLTHGSYHNLIENSTIANNSKGISIFASPGNTIRKSLISNHTYSGIEIVYNSGNLVERDQYISNNVFVNNYRNISYSEIEPVDFDYDKPMADFTLMYFFMGVFGFGLFLFVISRIGTRPTS